MEKVVVNCEVFLIFEDGGGKYVVRNLSCGGGPNVVLTTSPLGKAIYGREEGETVEFFNSAGEEVNVKIRKVFYKENVYNAP